MKKSRSNYQFQGMCMHQYIRSNTRNSKYHIINHTPVHKLYMGETTRGYQRKNQLNNWMKIIKSDSIKLLEITEL